MGHSQISSRMFHPAKAGRKIRFFVFALSLSILLTGIFVNYHHHSDKWEQEGCAICTVVHHLYANISILGSVLFRTVFLFFLYIVLGHVSVLFWGFSSHETRGPPNLS
jgi:Cu/Ag efflux pump CusA